MATESTLSLCFDLGSSSVRCSVYQLQDAEGAWLSSPEWLPQFTATEPNRLSEEGTVDPTVLLKAMEKCLETTILHPELPHLGKHIKYVSFASMAMSLVGLDEAETPQTPVFTYAHNTPTSSDAVESLKSHFGQEGLDRLYNETGTPLHSSYAPAVLAELERTDPAMLSRVRHWNTVGSWILSVWCGRPVPMSLCEASWTGLLNIRTCSWHQEIVDHLPLSPTSLPLLCDYGDLRLQLDPAHKDRWPLLSEANFLLPIADGAAANLGSGCVDSSRIAVTIGTSAAMRVILREVPATIPVGLWCYRLDKTHVILGGSLTDGGSVVAWLRSLMGKTSDLDFEGVMREVATLAPAAHGLTVLPFLGPERSTGFHSSTSGVIVGFNSNTTQAEVLQAGLESVALRLKHIYDLLRPHVKTDHWIVASGAALENNPCWRSIIASCFGHPLVMQSTKATSLGVAVIASIQHTTGSAEDSLRNFRCEESQQFSIDSPQPEAILVYDSELTKQNLLYSRVFQTVIPTECATQASGK